MTHVGIGDEIRRLLPDLVSVQEVSSPEADEFQARVRARHVRDPAALWWWSSLQLPAVTSDPAPGDPLSLLRGLLGADAEVLLAITDDEPSPWPMLRGRLGDIARLLGELWRVEYWLAPADGSWLVFETHHDALIVCGRLRESAAALARRGRER